MSGTVWVRRYATAGSAKLSTLPHQGYKCNRSIVGFREPWFSGPQPEVTFIFRQHNLYVFLPTNSPADFVYWIMSVSDFMKSPLRDDAADFRNF